KKGEKKEIFFLQVGGSVDLQRLVESLTGWFPNMIPPDWGKAKLNYSFRVYTNLWKLPFFWTPWVARGIKRGSDYVIEQAKPYVERVKPHLPPRPSLPDPNYGFQNQETLDAIRRHEQQTPHQ